MPIGEQVTIASHTGNGVATVFAYSFGVLAADDLKVLVNGVEVTTGFTVSGIGSRTGGTVTFSTAPTSGAAILIVREVVRKRDTDYQYSGDLREEVLDDDFDRIWMTLQEDGELVDRGVRVPVGETLAELPAAASRVNKVLTFGAGGAVALVDVSAFSGGGVVELVPADGSIALVKLTTAVQALINGALQKSGGTMTGALVLPGDAASALHAVPKQQLDAVAAARMRYVDAGSQPTTSGVAVDYTPIPSWARRLTLILSGVSTSGSSPVVVRLGTAASIVASGYAGSAASALDGLAPAVALMGTGFDLAGDTSAGYVRSGIVVLERVGATNTWVARGNGGQSDSRRVWWMGGSVDIGADLTRVRLTTVGGVDTFDGGSVSLLIEGV